ncbi:MAG: hypothetical protein M3408_01760 [Actinomycetota bacterium]|jgi:hypothetical protein|nr:hypothetical protein [Actinomycetota bacterium]
MSDQGPDAERMAVLRNEIDAVERAVLRHVDLGTRAVTLSVALLVLLVALVLPWIGPHSGLDVLRGTTDPAAQVGVLPRLFAGVAVGFGVVLSVLTLVVRRWGLVWASAFGCAYGALDGMWSIWSRQTVEGAGPGVGMVLAAVAVLVLAVVWFRLAVTRE